MSARRRLLAAVGVSTAAALVVSESASQQRPSLLAAATVNAIAMQEAESGCQFRFGVVADIQYCDCETASNFMGTEQRNYRGTLGQVKRAVELWNSLIPRPLFIAQLGDLIDGQNAGGYGAGLNMASPQSQPALNIVTELLAKCAAPIYHVVGNHELYNFGWNDLKEHLNKPSLGWVASDDSGYCNFSTRPYEGWTIITLNSYEVGLLQDQTLKGYQEAARLMREYNPNPVLSQKQGINFFDNLSGIKRRYVPFNGGCGERQRKWLRREVVAARERGDRVIVLSHLPIFKQAASETTLAFDCDDILRILQEDGCGHVVAFLAGHLHRGGYAIDDEGIHHITVESPLTHTEAYGYVDVFCDRLEISGQLSTSAPRVLHFPTLHVIPPTATPSHQL